MSMTEAPPAGLSDDEAQKYADLDSRLNSTGLSDEEAQSYADLDSRLNGSAPAESPEETAMRAFGGLGSTASGGDTSGAPPSSDQLRAQGTRSDVYHGYSGTPEQQRTVQREQDDTTAARFQSEAGVMGRVAGLFPHREARGSVDTIASNAMLGALAPAGLVVPGVLPLTAAATAAPEPVREAVAAPFMAIDKYLAEPVFNATGSESLRTGINLAGGLLLGKAVHKAGSAGVKAVGEHYFPQPDATFQSPGVPVEVAARNIGSARPGEGGPGVIVPGEGYGPTYPREGVPLLQRKARVAETVPLRTAAESGPLPVEDRGIVRYGEKDITRNAEEVFSPGETSKLLHRKFRPLPPEARPEAAMARSGVEPTAGSTRTVETPYAGPREALPHERVPLRTGPSPDAVPEGFGTRGEALDAVAQNQPAAEAINPKIRGELEKVARSTIERYSPDWLKREVEAAGYEDTFAAQRAWWDAFENGKADQLPFSKRAAERFRNMKPSEPPNRVAPTTRKSNPYSSMRSNGKSQSGGFYTMTPEEITAMAKKTADRIAGALPDTPIEGAGAFVGGGLSRDKRVSLETQGEKAQGPTSPGGPSIAVVDHIRKYGPAGEELAMKIIDHDFDSMSRAEPRAQMILDAEKALTRAERKLPREAWDYAIETGDTSKLTPGQKAYLEARIKPIEQGSVEGEQLGVRVNDPAGARVSRIAPDKYTSQDMTDAFRDKLVAGDSATVQRVIDYNLQYGKSWRPTRAKVLQGIQYWRDNLTKPHVSGVESERAFRIPPEMKEPSIFRADVKHIFDQARANSLQKNFNFRTPQGDMVPGGQGDYGDLLARIDETHPGASEWVRQNTEPLLGRDYRKGVPHLSNWMKFQAAEGVATNVSKLGGAAGVALSQPSQLANMGGTLGTVNTLRGILDTASSKFPKIRRDAVLSSAAPRYAAFQETAGLDTPSARMGRVVDNVVSGALTPVALTDAGIRTIGYAASKYFVESAQKAMAKGGESEAVMVRRLRKMGMRGTELERIRDGVGTTRDIAKLRALAVHETNIVAKPSMLPAVMSDPRMQVLFRLKKFQIGNTRHYLRNVVDEATKGNMAPLLKTAAWSIAVGEVIAEAKEGVFGPSGRRKDLKDILAEGDITSAVWRIADDLDNAAFLGLIGSMSHAAAKDVRSARNGSSPENRDSAFMRLVTPPSLDTMESVYDTAVNTAADPDVERFGKLAKDQLTLVREIANYYKFHTSEGLLKEIEGRSKKFNIGGGVSIDVPREGEETRVKQLRERLKNSRTPLEVK